MPHHSDILENPVQLEQAASPPSPGLTARFLSERDLPALIELEHKVWAPNQAASAPEMAQRIARHPQFSIGVFCPHTGKALASGFAKPACPEALRQSSNWQACAYGHVPETNRRPTALFGISLSSVNAEAAKAVFECVWPQALKAGMREWYLGSPIPGLREWRKDNPDAPVERYVFEKRGSLPRDRQLRYYHKRGFTRIAGVRANYFPHEESLDYGVLIGGPIPLGWLAPIWQVVPLPWLQKLSKLFFRLV